MFSQKTIKTANKSTYITNDSILLQKTSHKVISEHSKEVRSNKIMLVLRKLKLFFLKIIAFFTGKKVNTQNMPQDSLKTRHSLKKSIFIEHKRSFQNSSHKAAEILSRKNSIEILSRKNSIEEYEEPSEKSSRKTSENNSSIPVSYYTNYDSSLQNSIGNKDQVINQDLPLITDVDFDSAQPTLTKQPVIQQGSLSGVEGETLEP